MTDATQIFAPSNFDTALPPAHEGGLRVMAVASGGGHWVQLSRLTRAMEGHDCLWLTTMPVSVPPCGERPVVRIQDFSRSEPLRMFSAIIHLWKVVRGYRPDVVITTGAAPGLIALTVAKLQGARTIWLESIANADTLSMSGKMARHVADLRLTQWPHLAESHDKLSYFGQVL